MTQEYGSEMSIRIYDDSIPFTDFEVHEDLDGLGCIAISLNERGSPVRSILFPPGQARLVADAINRVADYMDDRAWAKAQKAKESST